MAGDVAITKTQRWLDLIAFLVQRRLPVSVEDLMEGVPAYALKWRTGDETDRASVRRMFERDKDELRAAGIPLETVPYTINFGVETVDGYRISGRDFYLPYLRIVGDSAAAGGRAESRGGMEVQITSEEAALALDALRRVAELPESPFADEARSAMAKLRFDLEPPGMAEEAERAPADLREAAASYAPVDMHRAEPVLFAAAQGTDGVRETLRLLTEALRTRTRVRFRYHGIHRGEPTDRDVAPYGLLYQHGQWYLIGEDATRDAIRVFRMGRMEAPSSDVKSPGREYEIPADFDVSSYARREPWELGEDEPLSCDVRFDFPLALWAERNGHGDAVEELSGGAAIRRFGVRQTEPFLRWLQSFGGDAIVVAPPEMRRAQAAMARETLEVYGA